MSGERRHPISPRSAAAVGVDTPRAAPAVGQYLDVLLREATEAPVVAPPAARSKTQIPVPAPAPAPATPVAEAAARTIVETAPPSASPAPESLSESPAKPVADGPPGWAAQIFQALEFDLGELRLVVPLVGLRRILPWRREIRRLPGSPPWLLGLYEQGEERVRVCDLARVIDSRRNLDALPADAGHLLILDGADWACPCTALGGVRWVEPEQVKWGDAGNSPPWRRGALRDGLRSLVDPHALCRLLQRRAAGQRGGASGVPPAADI